MDGRRTCDASGHWTACAGGTIPAYYADKDGDGYGAGSAVRVCDPPAGYVKTFGDCDDSRANRHPGAVETCGDGVDNDCNGRCDDIPGCLQRVFQRGLCKGQTNYMLCHDNMLTSDLNEGGCNTANASTRCPGEWLLTYAQPNENTVNTPLVRCYVMGVHYVTRDAHSCSNVEGTFGYLLASGGSHRETFQDCTQRFVWSGAHLEFGEFVRTGDVSAESTHCSGMPPGAIGPWTKVGDFGYTPNDDSSGSQPPSSCWGQ